MKTLFSTLTMVVTLIATAQSAPFPWVNTKTDYLSQPQEQAATGAFLPCFECTGNCSSVKPCNIVGAGLSCYTLQAFDILLNGSIFMRGCIFDFFCIENQACERLNQSRGGSLKSCSISCCNTAYCNAATPPRTLPPATTTSPPTTTKAPPTTEQSPPPTTSAPTTTTAPSTTTQPPTTAQAPTTTPPPTTTQAPTTTQPSTKTTAPVPTTTTRPPTTLPITVAATTPFRPGPCGGPLAGPSGYLVSPYYPLNYPNNAYCVWTIIVPQGSVLRIDFFFFETEKCYDFVKIYVGTRLVRYLTGDDVDDDDDDDDCDDKSDKDNEKDIFSWYFNEDGDLYRKTITIHGTGEVITIVFRSDHSVTKRGFFSWYTVRKIPKRSFSLFRN